MKRNFPLRCAPAARTRAWRLHGRPRQPSACVQWKANFVEGLGDVGVDDDVGPSPALLASATGHSRLAVANLVRHLAAVVQRLHEERRRAVGALRIGALRRRALRGLCGDAGWRHVTKIYILHPVLHENVSRARRAYHFLTLLYQDCPRDSDPGNLKSWSNRANVYHRCNASSSVVRRTSRSTSASQSLKLPPEQTGSET